MGVGDADFRERGLSSPCLQRGVELQVEIRLAVARSKFSDFFFFASSIQLLSIDRKRGVIFPEATIRIPKEKALVSGSWNLVITHLDCPRTRIEAVLPESPHVRPSTAPIDPADSDETCKTSFVCLPPRCSISKPVFFRKVAKLIEVRKSVQSHLLAKSSPRAAKVKKCTACTRDPDTQSGVRCSRRPCVWKSGAL